MAINEEINRISVLQLIANLSSRVTGNEKLFATGELELRHELTMIRADLADLRDIVTGETQEIVPCNECED